MTKVDVTELIQKIIKQIIKIMTTNSKKKCPRDRGTSDF
jgi:hypothetical protein